MRLTTKDNWLITSEKGNPHTLDTPWERVKMKNVETKGNLEGKWGMARQRKVIDRWASWQNGISESKMFGRTQDRRMFGDM